MMRAWRKRSRFKGRQILTDNCKSSAKQRLTKKLHEQLELERRRNAELKERQEGNKKYSRD
eukprot:TRINITY_DN10553_c0_g1_i1.p3 TRINITY_DN10553_c0_g1~~TRINITY_DN10553_c0_g1_i1.p3  ORF type:complete len:61 (+),score=18.89 TRINITY_DN10553_c0_g1_i1:150-332(+)